MPFELGLDIGCRASAASPLKRKGVLILDSKRDRYQAFISDMSGQDIQTHRNAPIRLIGRVRAWLRVASRDSSLPGEVRISRSFRAFTRSLPENCRENGLDRKSLLFVDYVWLAKIWIAAEREAVV